MIKRVASTVVAVIDDDDRVLDALGNLLKSAGYMAVLFGSADEFLADAATIEAAACLISDVGVVGVNGFELQTIMAERRPNLPVILITGRFASTDPRAISPNNFGIFEKPVLGEVLLDAVRKATLMQSGKP
jgi:FixJ family two-component response regulator